MVEDIPERGGFFGRRAPVEPPARRVAPGTEQPIEVHEHIEVNEEVPPPEARQVPPPAAEPVDERYRELAGFREERVREYHERVATRRTRRFLASGVLMFGLALVTAAWIFSTALYADMPFGLLGPEEVLAMGLLAFVLGTALALGNAEGYASAVAVSWVAGLLALIVAVREYLVEFDVVATNQALVALLGVFGLLVLVASTSAFVSWRGQRLQSTVLGHERDRRREPGRVT